MDTLENQAASTADMVRIPGGSFRMGSDRHYPEETPVHSVTVDGFWIDPTPVTNARFRAFVQPPRSFPPSFNPATVLEETLEDIKRRRKPGGG